MAIITLVTLYFILAQFLLQFREEPPGTATAPVPAHLVVEVEKETLEGT